MLYSPRTVSALTVSVFGHPNSLPVGAFWLSLAATMQPDYNAMAAYVDPNASAAAQAAGTAEYYNTFGTAPIEYLLQRMLTRSAGFFFMIMTVLSFFYTLASIRTNVILFIVFFVRT